MFGHPFRVLCVSTGAEFKQFTHRAEENSGRPFQVYGGIGGHLHRSEVDLTLGAKAKGGARGLEGIGLENSVLDREVDTGRVGCSITDFFVSRDQGADDGRERAKNGNGKNVCFPQACLALGVEPVGRIRVGVERADEVEAAAARVSVSVITLGLALATSPEQGDDLVEVEALGPEIPVGGAAGAQAVKPELPPE